MKRESVCVRYSLPRCALAITCSVDMTSALCETAAFRGGEKVIG